MPHIKFSDSNLKTLSADKTTWFTDPDVKGLRLCVTKGGVKTWWVNKWDSEAQKTRAVKLGQWANQGTHCAWAKKQVGKALLEIQEGNVLTKGERELERAKLGIPTFSDALEQYITHRTTARASGKARMMETTARDYRNSFKNHLSQWGEIHVDELPILEINQYLNKLQESRPNAAHLAGSVAGAVVRFINRLCALALPIPALLDGTKMKSRVETGKLDLSVPWADRKAEIDGIKNEHIRLCWMLTWYTGFRGRSFRSLTWDQVDLDEGTVTFDRLKRQESSRTIALSDDALRLFKRLKDIRYEDSDYVFPSRRVLGDTRGHIDVLDRLPKTLPGDLRHFWMTVAREVAPRHVHRWLAQQTMTDNDLRMLGHYGAPTLKEQKAAAEAIASSINRSFSETPDTVVELSAKRA